MLRTDRSTPLPVDIASELRDALSRRQKELPPRWLAAHDALTLRDDRDSIPGHQHEAIERELAITLLGDQLAGIRPRGVVCLQPSASNATANVLTALCSMAPISSIVAAELDQSLAIELMDRIRPVDLPATAIACDATVDLPLPINFPRPRVYLCLGNTLGGSTPVGAVRMLRVMRTTMMPGDCIVLGLAARRAEAHGDAETLEGGAARHLAALGLVQSATGASLDLGRFDFRRTYDAENCRFETHLVARRAFQLEVPGVCDVRLKKGESIRTSVSSAFDRARVSAMLAGVGLALRAWTTGGNASYVVALAGPAV